MILNYLKLNGLKSRSILPVACLLTGLALTFMTRPAIAATNVVRMVNFSFQPQTLTNNAGDTVVWTNTTGTGHNSVSSGSAWQAPALFTSPGVFRVTFTNAGSYAYFCSPHQGFGMTGTIVVRAAANQAPIVALTNPASGLVLAAPANLTLGATASDPDGTVTNVQFFSGAILLGRASTSPYSLTVTNLPAGVYAFTAQATDNRGLSQTSTALNVSVLNVGAIQFENPSATVNGNLPLRLTLTTGLRYAIDSTSDLTAWDLFANFLATNSVMDFTSPIAPGERRFFRARLLPNP